MIYTGNFTGPLTLDSARGGGHVKVIGNYSDNNPLFIVNHHAPASGPNEKFRVCGNGRVGIGTTSPYCILNTNDIMTGSDTSIPGYGSNPNNTTSLFLGKGTDSVKNYWGLMIGVLWSGVGYINTHHRTSSSAGPYDMYLNSNGGNVYIGKDANGDLWVRGGDVQCRWIQFRYGSSSTVTSIDLNQHGSAGDVTIRGNLYRHTPNGGVLISSDERVKENIVELSDDIALQKLRNINCYKYNYKDKQSVGNIETIGFIAQQLKQYLPEAVSIGRGFLPNELRLIDNPVWNELIDNRWKCKI